MLKLSMLLIFHIIGAIITIIVHQKIGTFEYAAEHGDGIRIAKPADVLFMDCTLWEFQALIGLITLIETLINDFVKRKI